MLTSIKRLTAAFLISVLLVGTFSVTSAEAALKKPGNCHFVRWLNWNFTKCEVAWDKVAGADGYETLLSWTDGSHAFRNKWPASRKNLYCLMENNHVNQFKVRAFKKKVNSQNKTVYEYAPWSNLTYLTPSPDTFDIATVDPYSKNLEQRITWRPVYGSSGYNIFLTTNPKGKWYWNHTTATKATATSAIIKKYRGSKLKKYTNYYVRIITRRKYKGVFCTVPMPNGYYLGSFQIK